MEVLGIVLVASGCAWAGFSAAEKLRLRVRSLDQLVSGLRLLHQMLELEGADLSVVMERLEQRCAGAAKQLFSTCRIGLEDLDERPFSSLWANCVAGLTMLRGEERDCLLCLGEWLGKCDSQAQCRTVELVCVRLEQYREQAEEACGQRGRLYRAIGLSGGAFLVILLL